MAKRGEYKLLISILNRGMGSEMEKLLSARGVYCSAVAMGTGTAGGEILQWLGLASKDKDVAMALIRGDIAQEVMRMAEDIFSLTVSGSGIVFTVPLASLCGRKSIDLLEGRRV